MFFAFLKPMSPWKDPDDAYQQIPVTPEINIITSLLHLATEMLASD
jgi:hypothetical protein